MTVAARTAGSESVSPYVIAVPVREQDHVDALGLLLRLGALRVAVEERIHVDALAAGRVDPEGRVAQPGQRSSHPSSLMVRQERDLRVSTGS